MSTKNLELIVEQSHEHENTADAEKKNQLKILMEQI
jgi:hypothetical protein